MSDVSSRCSISSSSLNDNNRLQIIETIQKTYQSRQEWILDYSIASPDFKRPSVEHSKESFSTERDVLERCVKKLKEYDMDGTNDCKKRKELADAWDLFENKKNDNDNEAYDNGLRMIVKASNDGEYDDEAYANASMDMNAFTFKIQKKAVAIMLIIMGSSSSSFKLNASDIKNKASRWMKSANESMHFVVVTSMEETKEQLDYITDTTTFDYIILDDILVDQESLSSETCYKDFCLTRKRKWSTVGVIDHEEDVIVNENETGQVAKLKKPKKTSK